MINKSLFSDFVAQWKQDTRHISNLTQKCSHPAYLQIIRMGKEVTPLILDELEKDPDDWFVALQELIGDRPLIPQEARGKIKKVSSIWLEWASIKGLRNSQANEENQ